MTDGWCLVRRLGTCAVVVACHTPVKMPTAAPVTLTIRYKEAQTTDQAKPLTVIMPCFDRGLHLLMHGGLTGRLCLFRTTEAPRRLEVVCAAQDHARSGIVPHNPSACKGVTQIQMELFDEEAPGVILSVPYTVACHAPGVLITYNRPDLVVHCQPATVSQRA